MSVLYKWRNQNELDISKPISVRYIWMSIEPSTIVPRAWFIGFYHKDLPWSEYTSNDIISIYCPLHRSWTISNKCMCRALTHSKRKVPQSCSLNTKNLNQKTNSQCFGTLPANNKIATAKSKTNHFSYIRESIIWMWCLCVCARKREIGAPLQQ